MIASFKSFASRL
uniref:Uncharacterized protein n=1 Tax=Anguilla anguilla TaxID=7936 RepID=A0A0E9R690_ANGAN